MSTFRKYDKLNPIVDFVATIRRNNGNPKSGEDIRVAVLDCSNNNEILFQAMPEIGLTGYYKYSWPTSFSSEQRLFATVFTYDGGNKRKIIDTIDIVIDNERFDMQEKIDENDGQAI